MHNNVIIGGASEMVVVQDFAAVVAGVLFFHLFHHQGNIADFDGLSRLSPRLNNAFCLRHSQSSFL